MGLYQTQIWRQTAAFGQRGFGLGSMENASTIQKPQLHHQLQRHLGHTQLKHIKHAACKACFKRKFFLSFTPCMALCNMRIQGIGIEITQKIHLKCSDTFIKAGLSHHLAALLLLMEPSH